MIATVLGLVQDLPPGAVGAHEHIWIAPVPGADPARTFILNDQAGIVRDLGSFASAGGAAVIDCQPPHAGRDLERLAAISRATGVAVIASTGFHLRQYYGTEQVTWRLADSEARDLFERDLSGRNSSGICSGIVKAAHPGTVDDIDFRRLLAAACAAARSRGASMQVHTERGRGVEALVEVLEVEGADPRRVILSHMDKRPDLGLHLELAGLGYLLEYDTFLRPKYQPEEKLWPLVEGALESGLVGSIACGLDLADPAMWVFGGGDHGMAGLLTVVESRLRSLGADSSVLQALLRDNICERVALTAPRDRGRK